MEEIIAILKETVSEVNFIDEKNLVTDGYIDSFDIVNIIDMIEEHFDISVPVESMVPENFESAEAIFALITAIKDGAI